jgi:hypothetical protein
MADTGGHSGWYSITHKDGPAAFRTLLSDNACETVGDLILKNIPKEWDQQGIAKIIGQTSEKAADSATDLDSSMPIGVLKDFNLKWVTVWHVGLDLNNDQSTSARPVSALDVLMSAARDCSYDTLCKNKGLFCINKFFLHKYWWSL